jgi:DNA-binding XRE family transcriptional regulator
MKEIKVSDGVFREYTSAREFFPEAFKSKTFVKMYEEERAKCHLIRQIKQARLKQNMTQKDLAEKADMPQSAIARIERGNHSFSFRTLSRIATALKKNIVFA